MSKRMQRIVILVVAVAMLTSLGAVGVGSLLGGGPQDPTTWSSAEHPRPEIAKPELPAPVHEQTTTGATETVHALLGSYTYMMTTGDTSVWSELVDPACSVCVQFMSNAQQLNSQGGYLLGGEFEVGEVSFDGTGDPPATGIAVAEFAQAPSAIIEEVDAEPLGLDAVTGTLELSLAWDGKVWRVTDMTLRPDEAVASDGGGASDAGQG
ncbi:DUF6318 family protein [Brachybacterium hainanense]|uniref:DUF6318 family protein n=1 Tax=Brachybacterium hainanense TaxID=1541174 RepID=A0ABV6RFG7_9MICO